MKPYTILLPGTAMPRFARALTLTLWAGLLSSCGHETGCQGWCGTAVIGAAAEPGSLFPPTVNTDVEAQIDDLVFLKLADVGRDIGTIGDSGFVPRLAQSWTFDDPRTIRFQLNPAAKWHDGVPVTGADVVFSWEVHRDTLVNSPARLRVNRVASVTAPDSHTVVIRFAEPYAEEFFDAVYHVRILPRHLLDTIPRDRMAAAAFGRHPVGAGPYRFVRWDAGQVLELAADSTFFLGRPGLPRLIWRFTADPAAIVAQASAGELDILDMIGSPPNLAQLRASPQLHVTPYPGLVYVYLQYNLRDPEDRARPHPVLADRAVRRAITMAIDRRSLSQAILGELATPTPGPITPAMSIWHDGIEGLPFDTAEARRTLAARGWRDTDGDGVLDRDGRRLSIEVLVWSGSAVRMRTVEIVQSQLRRVGIEVRIRAQEFNTAIAQAEAGAFDVWAGAYQGDPSPVSIAEVWSRDGFGGFNYGHYSNPEADALMRRARTTVDPAAARRLWREATQMVADDAPATFLFAPQRILAVHQRLTDVVVRPDQWAALLWTWRIPPDRLIDRDRYGLR